MQVELAYQNITNCDFGVAQYDLNTFPSSSRNKFNMVEKSHLEQKDRFSLTKLNGTARATFILKTKFLTVENIQLKIQQWKSLSQIY